MSLKEAHKRVKIKKASDFHSQRYQSNSASAQSFSSLSDHYERLRSRWIRLLQQKEDTFLAIQSHEETICFFSDRIDQISRELTENAKRNLQLWRIKERQIMIHLNAVEQQLREINRSPEKPRKKKNYVLKKIKEPLSDND